METGNPFYFGRMVEGKSFTDREKETKQLASNFANVVNTVLLSPRRWGKSSLVQKAGETAKNEGVMVAYLDAFAFRNELDFYAAYSKAVIAATASQWEERLMALKTFLKHITPKITIGNDSGVAFDVHFNPDELHQNAAEILDLPEKIAKSKGIRLVVCIDEFQNIAVFNESKAFQKMLRSVWQHHSSTCYCLYGSKFHMMQELFERQSMPFYRFGDLIHLEKISENDWMPFIKEHFKQTGKQIDDSIIASIIKQVDRHSYYIQQLSHIIWSKTVDIVTEEIFEESLTDMIAQNALLYQRDTEKMSNSQLNFLKAVASGVRTQLSSNEIIARFNLGTSANVNKVKKYLLNDEIIDIRNKEVTFIDPVYELWFKREMLAGL